MDINEDDLVIYVHRNVSLCLIFNLTLNSRHVAKLNTVSPRRMLVESGTSLNFHVDTFMRRGLMVDRRELEGNMKRVHRCVYRVNGAIC